MGGERGIDEQREAELNKRLTEGPVLYPFKGLRLTREDIVWLLARHEDGDDPTDRSYAQRQHHLGLKGLNLRGADLSRADLSRLPLSGIIGGEPINDPSQPFNSEPVVVILEGANLKHAHLEGADLYGARLQRADLSNAHLKEVNLSNAKLQDANLSHAHLENARLERAHLEAANLGDARLKGARLRAAHLEDANLSNAHLQGANLEYARMEDAYLVSAHLEGASLVNAHLEGRLHFDHPLHETPKQLLPADLRLAFFDNTTDLTNVVLGDTKSGAVAVADVRWNDVNLAVVDWERVKLLGDEREAHERVIPDDEDFGSTFADPFPSSFKSPERRLAEYQAAVRAYRQLAIALREQGLNEDASRYAYRAQVLQRHVRLRQRSFGRFLLSLAIDWLAGYGYKPGRSLIWYCGVILVCAAAYYVLGMEALEALVGSITAFHGRGFFSQQFAPSDPQAFVAAAEAAAGLIIEVCFIVTFTQRFFEK